MLRQGLPHLSAVIVQREVTLVALSPPSLVDGTIDKLELFKILTHSSGVSSGLAEADARKLIQEFDTNGDGVLDLNEFTRAITDSDLGDAVRESEVYANDLYDRRARTAACGAACFSSSPSVSPGGFGNASDSGSSLAAMTRRVLRLFVYDRARKGNLLP